MPRPRFTMRVALAFTAIAAVLLWQYSVVLRRREAMEADRHTFLIAMPLPGVPEPEGMARIGRLRELLGDRPVQSIYVDPGPHRQTEIDRLRELFPEADIDPRAPEYTY